MKMEVLISLWIMDCSPRYCILHCTTETWVWNPCRPSVVYVSTLWAFTWDSFHSGALEKQWAHRRKLFLESLLEVSLAGAQAMPFEVGCSNQAEVLGWSSSSLYLQGMFLSQPALTSTLAKYVRNWLITNPFPSPNKEEIECDLSMAALVCIFRAPRLRISCISVMLPINSVDKVWRQVVVVVWKNWWKTSLVLGAWQHLVGDGAGYGAVMIYKLCVTLYSQAQHFLQLSFCCSWLPASVSCPQIPHCRCLLVASQVPLRVSLSMLDFPALCPASFPSPLTAATAASGE